jgi:hypothetical protein
VTYALNRYNSGVLTSSNQFNTGGRLPWVEHRVVREKPLVWQPHSIYFIKPDNEEVSEHYWVDASGIPHQVGDASFTAWKAIAGNEAKTIHDFVAAVLASMNPMIPAANVVSGVLDIARIPDIDAGKVATGVLDIARIPTLISTKIPDIDASKTTTGVFDPARLTPAAWHDAANAEAIAANGHYSLVAGRTLNLVDIGEGNECWIRLADEAASWLPTTVNFDIPATWTTTTCPDPGPGSVVTIICHSAAKQFTFQR